VSALIVPTLEGEFFRLRELVVGDAASLQRYADDKAVWLNLFEGFPSPYTMADAAAWCDGGSRPPALGHVWGIEFEGSVIGCISIWQDKGWLRCSAEVGYWIGRPFWQRGITSSALKLVCHWAWQSLPELTRIYAPIFARNAGSQAVAKSCGFKLEGVFKQSAIKAGVVIDRTQWALLRPASTKAKLPRQGGREAFAADPDNGSSDK
jgi:[ribosomal protein S5]-alanine N-acetyltransferase